MKRLVLIACLVLISYFSHAKSEFNISLFDNSNFILEFDEFSYNQNTFEYSLDNVMQGFHNIKIFKKGPHVHNNPHGNHHYNNNIKKLIFSGSVYVPDNVKICAQINSYNELIITSLLPYYNNQGNNNGYYPTVMSNETFYALKKTVNMTSFSDTKVQVIKQAIVPTFVTSQQVFELVELLSFDSNKLEIAKFAYKYTIDKQNYFLVNKALSFSSSIDELYQYISQHPY